MKTLTNFLLENWLLISPVLLELILRLTPTTKDVSILSNVFKLLDKIIPNIKKKSLILLLGMFALTASAQNVIDGKAYVSRNASDTSFIQSVRTSYQTAFGNTGIFYFDKIRNKWRIWNGTQYVDLLGASGVLTLSNGLTKVGSNGILGGAITANTTVGSNTVGGLLFDKTGSIFDTNGTVTFTGDINAFTNFSMVGTGNGQVRTRSRNGSFDASVTVNSSTFNSTVTLTPSSGTHSANLRLRSDATSTTFVMSNSVGRFDGLAYGADYSSNYLTNPRAIADIGTNDLRYVPLTLSANTTLNTTSKTLTINDSPITKHILLDVRPDDFNSSLSGSRMFNYYDGTALEGKSVLSAFGSSSRIDTAYVSVEFTSADDASVKIGSGSLGNIFIKPKGATGTNGQFLQTDGTGKVTWATATATPAGSNTQVQFNNAGAFGASTRMTFTDAATSALNLSGATATALTLNSSGGQSVQGLSNNTNLGLRTTGTTGNIIVNRSGQSSFLSIGGTADANVNIQSGSAANDATIDLLLTGSATLTTGTAKGGDVKLVGGTPTGGNANGGDIYLTVGAKTGTGIQGAIRMTSASASLDFPSIAAGTSADLTITYNGAAVGDMVLLGPANASVTDATLIYWAWVSATNTVTVRCSHIGSGAAVDPAAGTFKVAVIK